MTTMQSASEEPEQQDLQDLERRLRRLEQQDLQDLERRLRRLEQQVQTLTVAVDAASRLQIRTPLRLDHDIRIAGGKRVRRILEKGPPDQRLPRGAWL